LAAVILAAATAPSPALPGQLPSEQKQLVADLDRAQEIIDSGSSSTVDVASASRFEQLATAGLESQPRRVQRTTLALMSSAAATGVRTNLAAAAALHGLVAPRPSLPPWKIVAPPPPATLLGYFRQAQSRFGVRWEYLAAIEFIETKFGRVVGLSTAGAEGPMQFLPSTWAAYGRGDVHDPRAAIFGAARYLVANGAPTDIAAALYHYNPSQQYVHAVVDYAGWMRADPRAYYGYYHWQVIYAKRGGAVILPVGFPRAHPVRLGPLLESWRR
jgi:transglycosylase-like protein with SLT domain